MFAGCLPEDCRMLAAQHYRWCFLDSEPYRRLVAGYLLAYWVAVADCCLMARSHLCRAGGLVEQERCWPVLYRIAYRFDSLRNP